MSIAKYSVKEAVVAELYTSEGFPHRIVGKIVSSIETEEGWIYTILPDGFRVNGIRAPEPSVHKKTDYTINGDLEFKT